MASIPRPGVEVIQELKTSSPTVVAPALTPCIIGPCNEIISATGANATAKVSIAAMVTGTEDDVSKDVSGLGIRVSIDGGADQEVAFALSPTGTSYSTSLIVTRLDAGLSGCAVTMAGDSTAPQVKFISNTRGDNSSLQFKKSYMRLTTVAAAAFEAGDELEKNGGGDPVIGIIVSVDPANKQLVVDLKTGTFVPGDGSAIKVDAVTATVDTDGTYTAYEAIGLTIDTLYAGASTYHNQSIGMGVSSLPINKGTAGKLLYDLDSIHLYRLQGTALKEFERTSTILAHRGGAQPTTLQQASLTVGAGGPQAATAITYTSLLGLNGSTITVEHIDPGGTTALSVAVTGNAIVVTLGTDTGVITSTAAQVANLINRDTDAKALVVASVGGLGDGLMVDVAATSLIPIASGVMDSVYRLNAGKPLDDRDSDSTTPYFFDYGSLASVSLGRSASSFTLTARGAQDQTNVGNYHGAAGNVITVTLDDTSDPLRVDLGAAVTDIIVTYDGPANGSTTTAAMIVAEINRTVSHLVQAVVGTTGADSPGAVAETTLTGGSNPRSFQTAEDWAFVEGLRTNASFGYHRAVVGSTTSFGVSESIKETNTNGGVVGVLREIDSTNLVLWIDPVYHGGALGAQAVGGGGSTITLNAGVRIPTDSVYNGWNVRIISGTGAGQTLKISSYVGATGVATMVAAWNTLPGGVAPDGTSYYAVEAPSVFTSGDVLYGVTSAASTTVTSYIGAGVSANDTLTIGVDGGPAVTVEFAVTDNTLSEVKDAINTAMGFNIAALLPAQADDPNAVLTLDAELLAGDKGLSSTLTLGGSAVEKIFGLTAHEKLYTGAKSVPTYAGIHEGTPFQTLVGDELWDGLTLLGTIVAVSDLSLGTVSVTGGKLKIDKDILPTSASYSSWWIKAKGITLDAYLAPNEVAGVTRPKPALIVNETTQVLNITQNQARKSDGTADNAATYPMYGAYTALRLDVAEGLQTFSTVTELESAMGPLSPSNPLAYGMYLAMLNASSVQVSGLGVADFSDDEPTGTYEAYVSAFEFLESKEVYALTPLTQSRRVHEALAAHVTALSASTSKRERICFVNAAQPDEGEPVLVGSGTGTLAAINTVDIDAESLNLLSALTDAEIDAGGAWSDFKAAGLYLDVTSSSKHYSIADIDGQTIAIQTSSFEPGENDDGFYSETPLDPNDLDMDPGGETVVLKVRGDSIDDTTSTGRGAQVDAMAATAALFATRRVYWVQPDQMALSYGGLEQTVPGYYLSAAICGQVAQQHPAQGFTNLPIVGFTRPMRSNLKYTETQMDTGAGSGIYWVIQDTAGGVIKCRHQLSTDTSSVETRELSITKSLDFTAKFLRSALKSLIGVNNITDKFLDSLSIVCQGTLEFLVTTSVLADVVLNNIVQDVDQPDVILVDVTVKCLYPANRLRVTLVV